MQNRFNFFSYIRFLRWYLGERPHFLERIFAVVKRSFRKVKPDILDPQHLECSEKGFTSVFEGHGCVVRESFLKNNSHKNAKQI